MSVRDQSKNNFKVSTIYNKSCYQQYTNNLLGFDPFKNNNKGLTDQLDELIQEDDLLNLTGFFEDVREYIHLFGLSADEKSDVLKEEKTKLAVALLLQAWVRLNHDSATFRELLSILIKQNKGEVARNVCEYLERKHLTSEQNYRKIQVKLMGLANKTAHQDKKLLSMIQKNSLFKSIIVSLVIAIITMFAYNITSSQTERNTLPRISIPLGPPPLIMTNFHQHKIKTEDVWYSTPVYTHDRGYKICLGVYANGQAQYTGTHVSGLVYFMKGEFDDELKWPFRGIIYFRVLDKLKDIISYIYVEYNSKGEGERVTGDAEYSKAGRGSLKFISHNELEHKFLYHDTLVFQIYLVKLL